MSGIDYNINQTREWKSIIAIKKIVQKTSTSAGSNIFFVFEGHDLESFVMMAKNKYVNK